MDEEARDLLLIRLDERTARADKVLFGNGQPGIVAQVNALTAQHKEYSDRVKVLETKEQATPGPKAQKATGLAAGGALLAAVLPFILKILGIPVPV
jgi:predicted component of type VI protein secretion system